MKLSPKLLLDLLMGLALPVFILNNLSDRLGSVLAYTLAALIPAIYVLVDTYLSRRFNVITSYTAAGALVRAGLAFWYVDGLLFALKDTAGLFIAILIFGGSLLIGRPIFSAFMQQVLNPETDRQRLQTAELFARPPVRRGFLIATAIITLQSIGSAIANFLFNLSIVVAPFGTAEFNSQVAQVNLIMGIAGGVLSFIAFGIAFYIAYQHIFRTFGLGQKAGDSSMWDKTVFEVMDEEESRTLPAPSPNAVS